MFRLERQAGLSEIYCTVLFVFEIELCTLQWAFSPVTFYPNYSNLYSGVQCLHSSDLYVYTFEAREIVSNFAVIDSI